MVFRKSVISRRLHSATTQSPISVVCFDANNAPKPCKMAGIGGIWPHVRSFRLQIFQIAEFHHLHPAPSLRFAVAFTLTIDFSLAIYGYA